MSLGTFLRHLRRESRGSRTRLAFFIACLATGVAAVVAVAGLSEGLDAGIRSEARALLAGDLAIRGREPIPEAVFQAIDRIDGAQQVGVRELLTLVAAVGDAAQGEPPARSILTELKSIDGDYPFYGDLELEPASRLAELLDVTSTVVAPEVLDRLGLAVGDDLAIGGKSFRIAGTASAEPDRIAGRISMGPRVFVSQEGLVRAGLERFGSRVNYRVLVRLPPEVESELTTIVEDLSGLLADDGRHRVETFSDAQPALREGLRRMERYLGLAALLSLIIGGLGITQTVRAWLAGRMDAIAVFRSLGYRPRDVLWLYLGQAVVLGILGSLVGVALGVALQQVAIKLLAGSLPVESFGLLQPAAWARGLALGVGMALLASLPPVAAARRVPPIRVLRRDAEPLPPSRGTVFMTGGALLFGLAGLASWQADSWRDGLLFTAALAVAAGLLSLAARGLVWLASRPRRRARLAWRHGLAALERPGAATMGSIVALGLGVLVLLGMLLVERGLGAELARDLPRDAPSAFLIDIQRDQWTGIEALLQEQGADQIDDVPLVMGRIAAIDGRSSKDLRQEIEARESERREGWALRRELRLTYLDELPKGNVLHASVPQSLTPENPWGDPDQLEISLEREFAEELGVSLGSSLTIDIQGVTLDLAVTSLREVDWGTFGINFFIVVEPEALIDAPQSRLAAARLPPGREQDVQDALVDAYPNVTLIRTREMLDKVSTMLTRLALGVRLLGSLTVLAGLAILAGAIAAETVRRGSEVALLKTLGMTRRQVMASFATEYALVGLVAGALGTGGGAVLAYFVLTEGMQVRWQTEPLWLVGAVLTTIVLSVTAGLAASSGALRKRPVEVLRSVSG